MAEYGMDLWILISRIDETGAKDGHSWAQFKKNRIQQGMGIFAVCVVVRINITLISNILKAI